MTIPRKRAEGAWIDNSTVDSEEFEHIDKYLSEAVHGKGGTYALTQPLVFGGDNLIVEEDVEVGGALTVDGIANLNGDVDIDGGLDVAAAAVIGTTLGVGGATNFESSVDIDGALDVDGAVALHSTLGVDGTLSVGGDVNLESELDVDGPATFAALVTANADYYLGVAAATGKLFGNVELRGILTLLGSSAIKARTVIGANADTSYSPLAVSHVYVGALTLDGERNYTIDDTNAQDGMRIEFTNVGVTHQVNILRPGGAGLTSIQAVSGEAFHCVVERIDGTWQRIDHSLFAV